MDRKEKIMIRAAYMIISVLNFFGFADVELDEKWLYCMPFPFFARSMTMKFRLATVEGFTTS